MSFSGTGFSFGIDIKSSKSKAKSNEAFLSELYELLDTLGAKIHLAKDHSMTSIDAEKFFENKQKFVDILQEIDPKNLMTSDMRKRLFEC